MVVIGDLYNPFYNFKLEVIIVNSNDENVKKPKKIIPENMNKVEKKVVKKDDDEDTVIPGIDDDFMSPIYRKIVV